MNKTVQYYLQFTLAILLFSCNDKATNESTTNTETTSVETTSNSSENVLTTTSPSTTTNVSLVEENNTVAMTHSQKAQLAVQTAVGLIGTPYQSAGVSSKGIDASGLTMLSWSAAGITIPRISTEQAKQGLKVSTAESQPGDLIFFSQQKGSKKISNCGIISKVDEQGLHFVYTSSKDGVKEVPMSPYWKDRLVVIRRIVE